MELGEETKMASKVETQEWHGENEREEIRQEGKTDRWAGGLAQSEISCFGECGKPLKTERDKHCALQVQCYNSERQVWTSALQESGEVSS